MLISNDSDYKMFSLNLTIKPHEFEFFRSRFIAIIALHGLSLGTTFSQIHFIGPAGRVCLTPVFGAFVLFSGPVGRVFTAHWVLSDACFQVFHC